MFTNISHFIAALFLGIASFFGGQSYGNVAPTGTVPAVFETYLASQQAVGDMTLSIASASLRDGSSLSGYTCFTIDSNTPSLEYECGTLTGTTMAVSVRGIDATTGTTTVSSLKFQHRRGADVKITDYPALTIATNQLNGTQNIPTPIRYDSSVSTTTIGTSPSNLASVGYVSTAAFGSLPVLVNAGGTGTTTFSSGLVYSNGTSALAATTTPYVDYITASSTVVASSFKGVRTGTKVNTEAATTTVDWLQGTTQELVLNQATTTLAFSNVQPGATLKLWVFQDNSGSRLISTSTYPTTIHWAGGNIPTLTTTANKYDILVFVTASSTSVISGAASLNY